MKHFFSGKIKVVLVIALLLAGGLAIVSNLTGTNLPGQLVQTVLTPIRSAAATLADQAELFYNYVFEYETLAEENERLKEELAALKDDARDADSIARENERLRQLLELKKANEDYELVDAYIISWSSSDFTNTFTINRGTSSGLKEGMCAITANGELAGLITEVGSNYAVVKTVLDSSLQISATIASSGYNGMVKGGYSSGLSTLLRMDYLPSNSVIRNKDQVVTTGSTIYPRNLIIGYVVDAGFNDTGVAKYAILEPAADIANLEQVFVLTSFSNQ
jgi:rod shape-determining protein MreC